MARFDRSTKINLAGTAAIICEPNVAEQDVLAAMLSGFGMSRVTRCGAYEELTVKYRSPCELVLMGVTAPADEGLNAVQAIRRDRDHPLRTTPIVLLSSYTSRALIDQSRDMGASFIISKPLSAQVLFDRILWLASGQKAFIDSDAYQGPDRRARNYGPPLDTPGRRQGDLSAHVGIAKEDNMSQDAIDDIMKPMRIVL